MSIGSPSVIAQANAALGANTLVASIIATVPAGNCIALWVTTNAVTQNISTPTDTQGNVYKPVPVVVGTNLNGQWFIASNVKSLVAGTDTITGNFSSTGGAKTLTGITCSGVAATNPIDQTPTGTTGNSTAPSIIIPAGTQNNELVLIGELNTNGGGQITWPNTVTPLDVEHQASNQYAASAGTVTTMAGSLTVTGTLSFGVNWAMSAVTLLPQLTSATLTGLVGFTAPNQCYKATCYNFGLTTRDAGDAVCARAVSRGINNIHPTWTKVFWNQGDYHLTPGPAPLTNGYNNVANYIAEGVHLLIALQPPPSAYTAADQTALANFLATIKAPPFNCTPSNTEIVLWQESELIFGSIGGTAAFTPAMAFFGPTVNASGLPLVLDIGMGGGSAKAVSYLQAGLAATGVVYTAIYVDYYFNPWSRGVTLDGVAAVADGASPRLPFGLGEFGCHVTDNYAGYFNYITGFFQARLAAGKKNANIEYYEGQCSVSGSGVDLTSPMLTGTDPRVPFYQTMYDTLTSPIKTNTVTVTNPGNKTNNINDVVSLQIVATDSDATQTLTFTATGLPTGLSISSSGLITGTVTTQQVQSVTVTATDGTGASGSTGFTWTVNPIVTNTVTVTNPGTQTTQLGAITSLQMVATDSNPAITMFTWSAAGLPPGLNIASTSGLISGSPSQIGSFSVSVVATDSTGSAGTANFTWTINNPNTLPAGKFTTLLPLTPSPIGNLSPAQELSYEIAFGITAGTGSTLPFTAMEIQFYDFDELATLQTPVSRVTWRVPMGTVGDPNGPAVVFGRGPMRGAFMRVQAHNVDTVDATLAFFQLVGTARNVDRDDWRWDCGGNSPVIPGFINATAATASLVLGGLSNLSVPAGQTLSRLFSMYAGDVFFRAHLNSGGPASVNVSVGPQPGSLFSSQNLWVGTVNSGTELTPVIALPRGPCLVSIDNTAGAVAATVNIEMIAIET